MRFALNSLSLKTSVIIGCCLLPFVLSLWQWQRGITRSAELAAVEAAALQSPQAMTAADPLATADRRRVRVEGRVVGDVLLWQGTGLGGRPDYRVWLPVSLSDGSMVMVDAGRVAPDGRLPVLPQHVYGNGRWQPWPQLLTLSGARLGHQGVVDAPSREVLVSRYGTSLRAGVVVLEVPLAGLLASPFKPAFDPQRHFAYALQWLLLGVLLLAPAWRLLKPGMRAHTLAMEEVQ